jgi:hypothetical protein
VSVKEKLNQAKDFVRNNWKELLALGGLAVVGAVLASRDSDGSSTKFSNKWFRDASDDELDSEREEIRLRYCDAESIDEADSLYNQLHRFDNEMIGRMNAKYEAENPDAQPRHREHGWYLPNDD